MKFEKEVSLIQEMETVRDDDYGDDKSKFTSNLDLVFDRSPNSRKIKGRERIRLVDLEEAQNIAEISNSNTPHMQVVTPRIRGSR